MNDYMLYLDDDNIGGQVAVEQGTVGGAGLKALKQYVQKNPDLMLAVADEETGGWIPVE